MLHADVSEVRDDLGGDAVLLSLTSCRDPCVSPGRCSQTAPTNAGVATIERQEVKDK